MKSDTNLKIYLKRRLKIFNNEYLSQAKFDEDGMIDDIIKRGFYDYVDGLISRIDTINVTERKIVASCCKVDFWQLAQDIRELRGNKSEMFK